MTGIQMTPTDRSRRHYPDQQSSASATAAPSQTSTPKSQTWQVKPEENGSKPKTKAEMPTTNNTSANNSSTPASAKGAEEKLGQP
jgi:hypothetical protein